MMEPSTNQQDTFVPFTIAERIQQLGDIDKDIVSLLRSTGRAVQAVGKKEPQDGNAAMTDSNQTDVFQESMDDFIRTLRRVNVGMRRQIYGLEEAGIITLRKEDGAAADSQGTAAHQPRLEPDGDGKIGGFDVGWLNSRSNRAERRREAELWEQAETFLRKLLEEKPSLHGDTNTSGS